jgi:zinc transport system substrate-binding protein
MEEDAMRLDLSSALKALALILALAGVGLSHAAPVAAEPPKVVATIKPIHSLAASVMEGVGEPALLLKGAASPHSYALKPSDARLLNEADVIIRVSENLEAFLEKSLKTLSDKARIVTLAAAPGLEFLPVREGGNFEAHDDGHGHGHGHGHSHGKKDHDHADKDVHFWLDPINGAALANYIAEELAKADAANAETYRANAAKLRASLEALNTELQDKLKPVADKPFIVFHDIMQYFETRYGLKTAGAITVSPERQPGAKRLREVRAKIEKLGAVCVFAEPQFPPKLVSTLVEKTKARTGTLDEVGVEIPKGTQQYAGLLRWNADNLVECLSGARS